MSPTKEELLAWLDTAVGLMAEHTAWDDKNGQEYAALRALLTDPTDPERREMLAYFDRPYVVASNVQYGRVKRGEYYNKIAALITAPDKGEK
jgi:hypothetical protein